MYASEFERLLYIILLGGTFKNQIIHIIEEKDDYTISDYVSLNFCMLIG